MLGGMHDRGHTWQVGCVWQGHVWEGACMAGACMAGGAYLAHMPPVADTTRYGDMVNELLVCILLECILVVLSSKVLVLSMSTVLPLTPRLISVC